MRDDTADSDTTYSLYRWAEKQVSFRPLGHTATAWQHTLSPDQSCSAKN